MTPFTLTALKDLQTLGTDSIIDVRSPSEFALDHVPGAINLPVLNDDERALVGAMYVQQSSFEARKVGGALVAQNTARHLQQALADKDGSWHPLVYCWRGGQRSGAFATILAQVGWRVSVMQGGYQAYRRKVAEALYDAQIDHRLVLIDGGTGSAKTALLRHLTAAGAQTIDLEALAGHRGSLFGETGLPQPTQKTFETRLAAELTSMDPSAVTFLEAESSKIGERIIPPTLWAAMSVAPRIRITAPLDARATFLAKEYSDLTGDKTRLAGQIDQLRPYHTQTLIEEWHGLAHTTDWQELARSLIETHYDPRYEKSAARREKPFKFFSLPDLEEETLNNTAESILKSVT